jgi:hypothetical protein
LEDFCSSFLGHLQTLLYFPIVLDFRTFLFVDFIYIVNPCPVETSRGSIYYCGPSHTLFYPLSLCEKKGEYMLVLDRECIFNRSSDFCP